MFRGDEAGTRGGRPPEHNFTGVSPSALPRSGSGLISFSRSIALEEAGHGITVNVVSPGFIEIPSMTESVKKEALRLTPAGRLGTPEEVASAILFFLSDSASLITGNVLDLSGGFGV